MADAAFERAIHFRRHDAYKLYNIGRYWVWRATTLPAGSNLEPPSVSCKKDGIDKFQGLFRRSLEIDRRYWKKAIEMVWKDYPDERIVMGIIPEGDKDLGGRVKKWLGPRK